jgi:16S rRNA processing protein RimM
MVNLNDCIEIGQFTRLHGYKGQVILKLNSFNFDEIEDMEWVFVLIDGLPVPFFISEFSERNSESLLVNLEDIRSIDKAKPLVNAKVYIKVQDLKTNGKPKSRFPLSIGYKVIDKTKGYIGIFDSFIDNADNPLLCIMNNKKEILLPLQEEFLISIDDNLKEIIVNCPSGLLDIFS